MSRPWETEEFFKHRDEAKKRFPVPPQTNYDRIISKTPEELAYFHVGMGCPPGIDVYEKCHDIGAVPPVCLKCWLEWLKSPVEVDT